MILKLRELKGIDDLGGTMRLGAWPCHLNEGSVAQKAERLTACGLRITGETPDQTYVEICEIPEHPWMLGCQFHPEFKSKPLEPHPPELSAGHRVISLDDTRSAATSPGAFVLRRCSPARAPRNRSQKPA